MKPQTWTSFAGGKVSQIVQIGDNFRWEESLIKSSICVQTFEVD